jgi:hypothetical protein
MATKESIKRLEHRLEALEIYVSKGTDGLFTVHTEEEPFFCFVRKDFNDLNAIVAGTLESYIRNFFDCDSVEVRTESVPIENPGVPVEHLQPFSRIRPTFGVRSE